MAPGRDRDYDENRSVWLHDKEPYRSAPPLERDLDVDVAILGGGFTGVSTAYHLSRRFPDRGIVLLEARVLANGASGRNGGQMLNWIHGFDPRVPEEAKRVYEVTRGAVDTVLGIIAEHSLSVPFRRDGHLEVYTFPRNAELAEGASRLLAQADLPLRFVAGRELADLIELAGVKGALLDPLGGQLDGVAYLRGLRPVLEARGVRIHESTPALRIREGKRMEIETPSAVVRASALVLATNAYSPRLGYFGSGLFPLHSYAIATEALPLEQWSRRGWKTGVNFIDDRKRLSYGTLTATGRVIFGGGSNSAYRYVYGNGTSIQDPGGRGYESMHLQLLRYLPRLHDVPITSRWSGPVALTLSRLCTMGVCGQHRNLFYALGYSGHGVTLANLAGEVLTDLYGGQDERWRGLPFYDRRLRYIPPEPFRFLGYHAYLRLTGRSPRVREGS